MGRVRWHYFFFALAAFDVVVIMLSLRLHSRTIENFDTLVESISQVEDRSRWLGLTEQCILELNAPGNDVFQTRDADTEQRRFDLAYGRLESTLAAGAHFGFRTEALRSVVNQMTSAAREIFASFRQLPTVTDEMDRARLIEAAGSAMSRMDRQQVEAIRVLDVLASPNDAQREELLLGHKNELQERARHERYFIAAILLCLVGFLWVGRRVQITERALAEQKQRILEERKGRLAAIGELCSSVAHGIRNPLAAIRSSAQLALELGELDTDTRSRLNDILSESGRLGDRVTGLLRLARTNADAFEPVSVRSVMSGVAQDLAPEFERRGVHLETQDPGATDWVRGDRRQLEQALIELISNAMDESRPGDRVRVTCERPPGNGRVVLRVDDQGPGVPKAIRPQMFDLFFTTRASGTGIGLATVMRVAKLHGGDVTVSDAPGGGARFELTLPTLPGSVPDSGVSLT